MTDAMPSAVWHIEGMTSSPESRPELTAERFDGRSQIVKDNRPDLRVVDVDRPPLQRLDVDAIEPRRQAVEVREQLQALPA